MDIYITEIDSGRKIQLPTVPEEISIGADGRFASYEIIKTGEVKIPEGRMLKNIAWESFFPGEPRKNEPWVHAWGNPLELDETFSQWRDNSAALKLVVTDTNINIDCYIANYESTASGGYGDINYSIDLVEKVDLVVKKTAASSSSTTTTRTTTSSGKTYTIKSGDCLWNIAKAQYGKGSEWTKIYNANKSAIEAEAKRRGYASSNGGNLIFPGQTLSIP